MTAFADIEVLLPAADSVGESPLWDSGENAVWWVDIKSRALRRREFGSGNLADIATPFMPSALALDKNGRIIVAGDSGWYRLVEDSSFEIVAKAPDTFPQARMNDGSVDSAGRFWVGTIPLDRSDAPLGRLYRLDETGVTEVVDGLRTQNGTAFSPDSRTFYLADSHPEVKTIWAFDFDIAAGALSNRRVFHRTSRGRPDGAAVDAEGCYWFAAIDAGLIVRLDPEGREMRTIQLPISRPTNLAFSGEDLATLIITSMSSGVEEEKLAGSLLATDVGVRGWPQPRMTPLPAIHAREARQPNF